MQFNDDTLMAFADGELAAAEAAEVEAALKEDPVLAKRVERFRYVRRALRATYDSVAQEPIPERFRALLGDIATHEPIGVAPPPVAELAAARERKTAKTDLRAFTPPAWAAIAASVLVGVLVGRALLPTQQSLFVTDNGEMRAGDTLARVLDTRLASAADNANADLRVGITFRDRDGGYCRTFDSVEQSRAVSGLACREQSNWIVRVAASEPAVSSTYQQAGSAAPAVLAMVDDLIAGEPLDADAELAARDASWRR